MCGFTGHGERGGLAVPVVAAREDRPMWEAMVLLAVGSPARGKWVASPCRWSLLKRSGQWGKS